MKEYPKTKNGKVLRKELIKQLQSMDNEVQPIIKDSINRPRRSMLFVPAYNEKDVQSSRTVLVDVVVLDLEGILPEQREPARAYLKKTFKKDSSFGHSEKIIRVNRLNTEEIDKDLEVISKIDVDSVIFSSVENAQDVLAAEKILQGINPDLELMIMIETPLGVLNIQEICAATQNLKCIIIGSNNLAQRLQINLKQSPKSMVNYMAQVVLAARAYGKVVIDGPFFDVSNEFSCEASSKEAFTLGCDGKAAVHPAQLEYINDIFTPKQAEVKEAKEMIEAFNKGLKEGKEVIKFGCDLVDQSRIKWSQRTITLYDRFKEIGQSSF
jgi:citrate lyase beta subunit